MIGHFDVFGIRLQILGRYHNHKTDGTFILEHLVGPTTYGTHTLDRRDAIVGNEHTVYHSGAAEAFHELLRGGNMKVPILIPLLSQSRATRHAGSANEKGDVNKIVGVNVIS